MKNKQSFIEASLKEALEFEGTPKEFISPIISRFFNNLSEDDEMKAMLDEEAKLIHKSYVACQFSASLADGHQPRIYFKNRKDLYGLIEILQMPEVKKTMISLEKPEDLPPISNVPKMSLEEMMKKNSQE